MATIPKNYWAEDDTTEGKFRIFSYPKYYKDDQEEWQEVSTSVVPSTRQGYAYEVTAGVYKLWIKSDGTFTFRHWDDERTFKLGNLVLRNEDTGQEVAQSLAVKWPVPTVQDNTITWTFASGVVYSIQYGNDTLKDVLTLPEGLKNTTKLLVPLAWAGAEVSFGLKYAFTVEEEGTTVVQDDKDPRKEILFRDNLTNNVIHRIRSSEVDYPGKPVATDLSAVDDTIVRR